jgi:hypothetical protein
MIDDDDDDDDDGRSVGRLWVESENNNANTGMIP